MQKQDLQELPYPRYESGAPGRAREYQVPAEIKQNLQRPRIICSHSHPVVGKILLVLEVILYQITPSLPLLTCLREEAYASLYGLERSLVHGDFSDCVAMMP